MKTRPATDSSPHRTSALELATARALEADKKLREAKEAARLAKTKLKAAKRSYKTARKAAKQATHKAKRERKALRASLQQACKEKKTTQKALAKQLGVKGHPARTQTRNGGKPVKTSIKAATVALAPRS